MTTLTPQTADSPATIPAGDFFAPGSIHALFWRPRYRVRSPVVAHAPFLFWLVGVLRARQVAVLGAGDGAAHFLLCQAIDKQGGMGRCLGAGFWQDRKSGAFLGAVPEDLAEHADQFYDGVSDLRAFDALPDALSSMAPQGLDLLFVDLAGLPEGEMPQFDDFAATLAENAVLVVHGTRDLLRRRKGLSALAKQLAKRDRLDFREGAGLAVVPVGADLPARLKTLVAASRHGSLPQETEVIFRRLGQSLLAIEDARDLRTKEAAAREALLAAQETLKAEQREVAELRDAYEVRSRKLSVAQSSLFDAEAETTELRDQVRTLQSDLAAAREAHASLESAREALAAGLDAETAQRAEIQGELTSALRELDATRSALQAKVREGEDLQRRIASAEAERDELKSAHEAASNALEDRTRELGELRARLAEIEAESAAARAEHETARAALNARTQEVEQLRAGRAEAEAERQAERVKRFEETAALTRMAEELRARVAELETKRDTVTSEGETAADALRAHEKEAESLRARLAEADAGRAAERAKRFEETAALTRMAEDLRTRVAEAQADRDKLEREKAELRKAVDKLLESTSWQLTAPIRAAKKALGWKSR